MTTPTFQPGTDVIVGANQRAKVVRATPGGYWINDGHGPRQVGRLCVRALGVDAPFRALAKRVNTAPNERGTYRKRNGDG